jgi:hypothetical protein
VRLGRAWLTGTAYCFGELQPLLGCEPRSFVHVPLTHKTWLNTMLATLLCCVLKVQSTLRTVSDSWHCVQRLRLLTTSSDSSPPTCRYLPPETQVVLVSATLPHDVLEMTSKFMTDPVRVLVKRDELTLEVRF